MEQAVNIDVISKSIQSFLVETGVCNSISNSESLALQGVDSFTFIEILVHLEQEFKVALSPKDLTSENTKTLSALSQTYLESYNNYKVNE